MPVMWTKAQEKLHARSGHLLEDGNRSYGLLLLNSRIPKVSFYFEQSVLSCKSHKELGDFLLRQFRVIECDDS